MAQAYDIIVLGSGAAGLSAAVTAAEAGKKVLLLEKNQAPGGATNTVIVVRVLRDEPAFIDKAFRIHMEMTHQLGNPHLVRTWLEKDAKLEGWLRTHDIKFDLKRVTTLETLGRQDDPLGGFPPGHLIADRAFLQGKGNGHGGAVMVHALLAQVRALGCEARFSMRANRLLVQGGKVCGVAAEDAEGAVHEFYAKAVVLGTAGFNQNAEMIKQYSGFDFTLDEDGTCEKGDFFFIWPWPKFMGDGINMAWQAGAGRGAIGVAPFPHMPGPGIIGRVPWNHKSQLRIVQEQPYLWVNQNGRRFIEEGQITDHFTSGRVVVNQPGHCAYLIFDQATKERMEQVELDYTYFIFKSKTLTDLDGDIGRVRAQGNKHIFVEDNLEALCEKTGMPLKELRRTIDRYNHWCEAGRDGDFGKDPRFLRPVRTGRLYCLRVYTTAYQTIGGLKVDGGCAVLREDGTALPGLYAAGDIIAAELFGEPPICGIGNAGIALSTGIAAGESAARYCEEGETGP